MRGIPPLATLALAVTATLGLAGSAQAAITVDFTVVNQRGIDQLSSYRLSPAGSLLHTNPDGRFTASVTPGDTLSVLRAAPQGACGAPEGTAGVSYSVTSLPAQTVVLPNTTGPSGHTTPTATESWIVGRLNQDRAAHSPPLPALLVSSTLTQAAFAIAHDRALSSGPFPPPYCYVNLSDWGWPAPGFALEDSPFAAPEQTLGHWDGTAGDAESATLAQNGVFDPANTAVGVADGGGTWIVEYNDCSVAAGVPTAFAGRCGMTTDTGDPTAYTPPPPVPPAAPGTLAPIVTGAGPPPGGTAPGATAPRPAPPDTTAPTATLTGSRSQKVAGTLVLTVSCRDEACTATAGGSVRVPKIASAKAKAYRLGRAHTSSARNVKVKLVIALPPAVRRAVTRALAAHRRISATVVVTVADAAGNTRTQTRRIALRRR